MPFKSLSLHVLQGDSTHGTVSPTSTCLDVVRVFNSQELVLEFEAPNADLTQKLCKLVCESEPTLPPSPASCVLAPLC